MSIIVGDSDYLKFLGNLVVTYGTGTNTVPNFNPFDASKYDLSINGIN